MRMVNEETVLDYPAPNALKSHFTYQTFCRTENEGQKRTPTGTHELKLQLAEHRRLLFVELTF